MDRQAKPDGSVENDPKATWTHSEINVSFSPSRRA